MDGRLSDLNDIFILFMKMRKESCSRLGYTQQHKLFGGRYFQSCPNKYKHSYEYIFVDQIYVNDPKEKYVSAILK